VYSDRYHPQVKKDIKRLDKSVQKAIKNIHIEAILSNPYKYSQLKGNLSGIYSYHFKQINNEYRICYIVYEKERIVYILMIAKRENFYKLLEKRIKNN
jgi:addiction module RelE/StbE family toxin